MYRPITTATIQVTSKITVESKYGINNPNSNKTTQKMIIVVTARWELLINICLWLPYLWLYSFQKYDMWVLPSHVVPQERTSLLNYNGENKEEYLREISGNLQSQERFKLAPKICNSEFPTGEISANKV